MNMKVFAALYNQCIYESSFGVLSLHLSDEGAQAAIAKQKRKEEKSYKGKLPDWVQFKVEEMKVLP